MRKEYIERTGIFVDVITGLTIVDQAVAQYADAVLAKIQQYPAADVVEVKHGRWMMTLYTTTSKRRRVISNKKYDCSECGYSNGRKQSPYCPNCGAKMDGGKDNG